MKLKIAMTTILLASSAHATNQNIKICNTKNPSQSLQIIIDGQSIKTIDSNGSQSKPKTATIKKEMQASQQDLDNIASSNGMTVKLVEGTAYLTDDDDVILIVKDNAGVKYLVQMMGPNTKVLGSSSSCK